MLYYAAMSFAIAAVAALFGFTGIASGAVGIARVLTFAFLAGALIALALGGLRRTGSR